MDLTSFLGMTALVANTLVYAQTDGTPYEGTSGYFTLTEESQLVLLGLGLNNIDYLSEIIDQGVINLELGSGDSATITLTYYYQNEQTVAPLSVTYAVDGSKIVFTSTENPNDMFTLSPTGDNNENTELCAAVQMGSEMLNECAILQEP